MDTDLVLNTINTSINQNKNVTIFTFYNSTGNNSASTELKFSFFPNIMNFFFIEEILLDIIDEQLFSHK